VDGFNLYYGCLKDTPYRWLDIAALCRLAVPGCDIHRIKVFTARVAGSALDPSKPDRQAAYLRALRSTPLLTIHFGYFQQTRVRMATVTPPPATVEVWKTEEKGSDVNLAAHLLADGFRNDYESALVLLNDADLAEPIRMVKGLLRMPVTVLHPIRSGRARSVELRKVATASVVIEPAWLAASQFPPVLRDSIGVIHKPASW
jgi:hypothetical protein